MSGHAVLSYFRWQVHLRMAEEALTDEMAESRERERRRLEEVQVTSLPKRRFPVGFPPSLYHGGVGNRPPRGTNS